MGRKVTEKITLWGIVQGVGFRPFVAKIADRMSMTGEVLNKGGLVEIVVTDTPKRIDEFVRALEREKPAPAEIVHIKRETLIAREFTGFTILSSDEGGLEAAMIPADLAVCPDCLREMYDKENRRYMHPFISCMVCGPRYTIIDRIPYDRDNTAMIDFPMCSQCEEEYTTLTDRRYHAQTISCHDCGPQMEYKLNTAEDSLKGPLEKAAALLKEGRVIAFKSMGGYNLIANPFDEQEVSDLREVKNREEKPFAIMFRSVEEIKEYCYMNEVEEKLITSSARPILLLERKPIEELQDMKPRNYSELAKSRFVGAFLPSMGGQYIMLDYFGGPLIVTSANSSGMPIIRTEKEMFDFMDNQPLVSEAFYNLREIRVTVDDSVVRVIDGQPQMIRRSKGYAPVPLYMEGAEGQILAAGGQLKNSFCVSKGPFAYVSQYFGDMDTVESQEIYNYNVDRMSGLFRITPEKIVCDMHPLYYTTKFAETYAKEHDIPLLKVQHHHAHVGSVMAEHSLRGPVIGVSFDGTGYGTDGNIWGGEFLVCENGEMIRAAHLKYVKMIGGDRSMKEAWKSAASYIHAVDSGYMEYSHDDEITVDIKDIIEYAEINGILDDDDFQTAIAAMDHDINTIYSSSMGRLFDAVSAMLGICSYNEYEGECAMLLEDAAAEAIKNPGEEDSNELALMFHQRIAEMIRIQCLRIWDDYGIRKVALTGGTFQNKILMEMTLELLRNEGFEVYYNVSVSPNDGGIALGQTYIASMKGND
ncbi:MAG: carbamoyltransferase HypF [Eubacteriaceae bacterium]|jgi:hydrogenase maturation protein HypF|nr:carbamoyltransferase HypF [Eubacteriaceae bacterium]